jgi:hypothetical protein
MYGTDLEGYLSSYNHAELMEIYYGLKVIKIGNKAFVTGIQFLL